MYTLKPFLIMLGFFKDLHEYLQFEILFFVINREIKCNDFEHTQNFLQVYCICSHMKFSSRFTFVLAVTK